jgi:hypothetical protein
MVARTTRRTRTAAATAVLALVALVSACSASPGASMFRGGTYDLDLSLPPQHASQSFPVANLGTCTVTVDTPRITLPGATLTVPDVAFDQVEGTATIAGASVLVPHSTIPVGTVSLECFGEPVGSVAVSVELEASASVASAVFDVDTRTITLTRPTISIPAAKLIVTGGGLSLPPIALPPVDVSVPTVSVPL